MCPNHKTNGLSNHTDGSMQATNASMLIQAFSLAPAAIAITRFSDGLLLEMNAACLRVFDLKREEIADRAMVDWNFWPSAEARSNFLSEMREKGRIYNRALTMKRHSGQPFPAILSAELITQDGEALLISSWTDNTETTRQKQKARECEERYQRLFVAASDAIFLVDIETGLFVDANPSALNLYGYSLDDFLQLKLADISAEPAKSLKAVRERETFVAIRLHRKKDGTLFPVEIFGDYFESDGRLLQVAAIRDITDRLRAEEDQRSSEARLRFVTERLQQSLLEYSDLVNQIPIGVYKFRAFPDGTYGFDYVSPRWCEILEMSEAEALNDVQNTFSTVHPDDLLVLTQTIERSRQTLSSFVWEGRKQNKAGEIRWLHAESRPILLEAGGIRWDGIVYDITARKQAEEALQESEKRFRTYYEQAPLGIAVVDSWTGQFAQVNPAYCRITGFHRDSLLQTTFQKITHPADVDNDLEHIRLLRDGQAEMVQLQKRYVRPDGSAVWANLTIVPLWERGTRPTFHLTMAEDITEQKMAEEALLKANQQFLTMTKCIPDTIWATDLAGRITYISPNVERTHGYTPEEALQRSFRKGVTPRQATESNLLREKELELATATASYDHNKILVYESEEMRKDGGTFPAEVTASFIWSEDGKPLGITGITRDITDRKRQEEERKSLEDQLRQAQKMDSIGRLAGGVAHDYNNMLGVILGRTEMALEQIDPSHSVHGDLVEIQKAASRSADLTRQLLAFARKQIILPRILDLNDAISGILAMLHRLIGENIRLDWKPGAALWPVRMDPSQIDQILANLCVNSRDAISGIGQIVIQTANFEICTENFKGHEGCVPGEYVQISVGDDGRGMDEATLANIFEPFFTTKGVGEGTGLGLATVYGIVRQNNGFVHVESKPGNGTMFEMYLPRYTGAPEESEVIELAPASNKKDSILLVEDEPTVLKLAQAMLRKLGYAVLAAPTPGEALRLADAHSREIDIIITDIVMPEMNGRDLAAKLQTTYPHLQCVFMSGWTADAMVDQGMLDPGTIFLQKPFSMKELANALQRARQRDA